MQFLEMTVYGLVPDVSYNFTWVRSDDTWRCWVNGIEIWAN